MIQTTKEAVQRVAWLLGNPSSKIHQLALASEQRVILALCALLTTEIGDSTILDMDTLREEYRRRLETLSDRLFASYLNED